MANLIDEMEARIFAAQLARLSRITGRTVDGAFISEMYKQVKARYLEELKKRIIRLRELDGARLDEIVSYIFYYHIFHTSHFPPEIVKKAESDPAYREVLVRDVAVYIVINEHLNVEKRSNTSEYSPEIAAYNMACSFSLYALGSIKGTDRRMNGMNNLFKKSLVTIKSVVGLLAAGNSCDAVILWRHLHELECVLAVLGKGDDELFFRYVKHMEYLNMEGNPHADELNARLSEECKAFGVKERNAFVNYGWLLHVPGFREGMGKEYRLNFKEGLQKAAGLTERHAAYASASKILHPSAWVVAIRDDKFYKFTVFELYKSLVGIVGGIKDYLLRYREFSQRPAECDNYGKSIDGYLKMIEANNRVVAIKYAERRHE